MLFSSTRQKLDFSKLYELHHSPRITSYFISCNLALTLLGRLINPNWTGHSTRGTRLRGPRNIFLSLHSWFPVPHQGPWQILNVDFWNSPLLFLRHQPQLHKSKFLETSLLFFLNFFWPITLNRELTEAFHFVKKHNSHWSNVRLMWF